MARLRPVSDPTLLTSVMATGPAAGVSGRYQFIPTTRVIDLVAGEGWKPVAATQTRVRNEELEGFQKHLIRFRKPDQVAPAKVGDIFPEVVLTNGHAGLDCFTFSVGLFRLACSNGLIVADSTFESLRIRHMGFEPAQVYEAIRKILEAVPQIYNQVERYRAITLTETERNVFAESAALIKYDAEELEKGKILIPRLLAPVRSADAGRDLWSTYNVLQEKLIRGGRFATRTIQDRWGAREKLSKARGVTAISENVRINKALWHLTSKMAELKTGVAA